MMPHRALGFLQKAFMVVLAFAVVAYILVSLDWWAADFRVWFLRTGNIEMLIYLSVFIIAITYVLKWFLKKEIRAQVGR